MQKLDITTRNCLKQH